jgi:hypothetical protein
VKRAAGEVWHELSGGTLQLADVDRRHVVTTVRCAPPCKSLLGKIVRAPEGGLIWVAVLHLERRHSGHRRAPAAAWLDDPLDSRGNAMTVEMTCRNGAFYSFSYAVLIAAARRQEKTLLFGASSPHQQRCMP